VQVIRGRKPVTAKDLPCKKHSSCELWTFPALGRKVAGSERANDLNSPEFAGENKMRATRTKVPYFLVLLCCLLNAPAFAGVQGQSAAFTLDDMSIGAFVVADSGRLYRVVLNLQSQNAVWEDLGGTQLRPSVAALNPQLAFVIGGDGNLYAKYWDGNAWQWSYQGNPGVTLSGNMSAITYVNNGTPNDAVFVVGDDNSLYVNWRNGGEWQWSVLGGTALTHYVSAVAYQNINGLVLCVYAVGGDGNLYLTFYDHFDKNAWVWSSLGRPNVDSVAFPSAQHVAESGIVVFVVGSNGHLYSSDGWRQDTWFDLGGSQLVKPPAAQGQQLSAFVVGGDGTLYKDSYNDWTSPGGCSLRPFVSPTYAGTDYWIFVIGANGGLYAIKDINTAFCWNWYGYDLSAYPGSP
jgi:hypothetical protein